MALNSTTIKNSFLAKLNSLSFDETTSDADAKEAYAQAMADWVIQTIESATVSVPGTGLIAPSGGGTVTGISSTGTLS